jgi:hypothetical protein
MVEPLLVCPQAGKLVKEEFKYLRQRNPSCGIFPAKK